MKGHYCLNISKQMANMTLLHRIFPYYRSTTILQMTGHFHHQNSYEILKSHTF